MHVGIKLIKFFALNVAIVLVTMWLWPPRNPLAEPCTTIFSYKDGDGFMEAGTVSLKTATSIDSKSINNPIKICYWKPGKLANYLKIEDGLYPHIISPPHSINTTARIYVFDEIKYDIILGEMDADGKLLPPRLKLHSPMELIFRWFR